MKKKERGRERMGEERMLAQDVHSVKQKDSDYCGVHNGGTEPTQEI